MSLSPSELIAERARLWAAERATSAALQTFPRGPMGLVSDAVLFSQDYQAARAAYQRAFQALRAFNRLHLKSLPRTSRA